MRQLAHVPFRLLPFTPHNSLLNVLFFVFNPLRLAVSFDLPRIFCYDAVTFGFSLRPFPRDRKPGSRGVKGSRKAAKLAKKIEMHQKGEIIRDFFTADI